MAVLLDSILYQKILGRLLFQRQQHQQLNLIQSFLHQLCITMAGIEKMEIKKQRGKKSNYQHGRFQIVNLRRLTYDGRLHAYG